MPYVIIEDFRGGVDRRKIRSAGVPGTLWEGINGHLTRGGEFEVRKAFVEKYDLPAGTFGLQDAKSALYTFGSGAEPPGMPAGVTYQRLTVASGASMTGVRSTEVFDGLIYVIAEYDDGRIHHFYDGSEIVDWEVGKVLVEQVNNDGIARDLATRINADVEFVAVAKDDTVIVTAVDPTNEFSFSGTFTNVDNGQDDQEIGMSVTSGRVSEQPELLAQASFEVTEGTFGAATNKVTSIKVDGVEILGADVDWGPTSHSSTAANIADQINTYDSGVDEYFADAVGPTVFLTGLAGSGVAPNGKRIAAVTAGDMVIADGGTFSGGVNETVARSQEVTALISGTFEVGDQYTITLNDKNFGFRGNPASTGTLALTHGSKIYSVADGVMYFCALNDPAQWNTSVIGAGFTNMANHDAGSSELKGLGIYQDSLAVFAENSVQVWFVAEDDNNNVLLQKIPNTGTRSPGSVVPLGNTDLLYLSDSGVRSLRARLNSNLASVNDVGTAIDTLMLEVLSGLTDEEIEAAVGVIEPIDARYWLAIGDKIFVYSHFPTSKISAWTWYEPGFEVSAFARVRNRVYARSGDKIYLYGGNDNNTYEAITATVTLPFMSGQKQAHEKQINGFDAAVEGEWDVSILIDPNHLESAVDVGKITGPTFSDEDIGALAHTSHVAPKMVHTKAEAGKISQVAVHFGLRGAA